MKEAYVKFDTAKLLNDKGFDWDTDKVFERSLMACRYEDYPMPTQQMACKWLRGKQIDILPDCSLVDRKYSFHIINRYKSGGEIIHSDEIYDKYEDAIEAALQYCLTKLIEQ